MQNYQRDLVPAIFVVNHLSKCAHDSFENPALFANQPTNAREWDAVSCSFDSYSRWNCYYSIPIDSGNRSFTSWELLRVHEWMNERRQRQWFSPDPWTKHLCEEEKFVCLPSTWKLQRPIVLPYLLPHGEVFVALVCYNCSIVNEQLWS